MDKSLIFRNVRRKRRAKSVRRRIQGTAAKPRFSIMRSNKHLYAQLIDDENQKTIVGIGTMGKKVPFGKKSKEAAKKVGEQIAAMAKEHKISEVIFDRGAYKYHGLVAEVASGAREAGLKF